MSKYQCQQCQQMSNVPFAGGKCSKCGSLNIRNIEKKYVRRARPEGGGYKTILMAILWVYVLYELWQRTG